MTLGMRCSGHQAGSPRAQVLEDGSWRTGTGGRALSSRADGRPGIAVLIAARPGAVLRLARGVGSRGRGSLRKEVFDLMAFDVAAVRAAYPALADGYAYLDGAAGTQVPSPVIEAIGDAYRSGIGNAGGLFPASIRSAALTSECRSAVADLTGGGVRPAPGGPPRPRARLGGRRRGARSARRRGRRRHPRTQYDDADVPAGGNSRPVGGGWGRRERVHGPSQSQTHSNGP